MRVFDDTSGWLTKTNFVDVHNVVVGYDTDQHCCERAGYFWTKIVPCDTTDDASHYSPSDEELAEYRFDTTFFEPEAAHPEDDLYEGGCVAFRCVADGRDDLFLVLFNAHNGYYSHGFTMDVGGSTVHDGSI